MDYKKYINEDNNTITDLSEFICDNGVSEYQVMIHITQPNLTYQEQLAGILNTFTNLLTGELKGATAVFKRYFLSDAANQADTLLALTTEYSDCALSVVEQPPLNGTKSHCGPICKPTYKRVYCPMDYLNRCMAITGISGTAALSIVQRTPNIKRGYCSTTM